MMYGEEKKSNLKKTSSSSTFGTKIADSKMGTQCGGGVLFLHQQHSAVGPRAAGSEEHVVQGGGLRGDQAQQVRLLSQSPSPGGGEVTRHKYPPS